MSKVITKIQNYIGKKTDKTPECSFETDLITIPLTIFSWDATYSTPGWIIAPGESIRARLYISDRIDSDRKIKFTFVWYEADDLTIEGSLSLWKHPSDGTTATTTIDDGVAHNITFAVANRYIESTHYISASDVDGDTVYTIGWLNGEALHQIFLVLIQVEYYVKRYTEAL